MFWGWVRSIAVVYLWDKVVWTFLFSLLAWFITFVLGNMGSLSKVILIAGRDPPQILSTIDNIFTVLSMPALIVAILIGIVLLTKLIKSAVNQMFS